MVMDSDEFSSISSSSLPSYSNKYRSTASAGPALWFKILQWVSIIVSLVSIGGWIWIFVFKRDQFLNKNMSRLLAFITNTEDSSTLKQVVDKYLNTENDTPSYKNPKKKSSE